SVVGCALFHRDFDIAVGNRTANPVSIFVNGGKVGDVGSNSTARFTVEESPIGRITTDSGVNPASTSAIAQVTVSARDVATGALSAGVPATLLNDVTTYLDVAPCVVTGDGEVPPCVTVASASISVPGGGTNPPAQCTFSLSASSQSFDLNGGTGSVN